jgi:hypothetical protein
LRRFELSQRTRFFLAAAIVLVVGLLSAATIYLVADDEPSGSAYVIVGDSAYAVDPTRSKTYVMQLERFGGKAAVLFDDFNRWFAARWQGKALGITVAWLSIAAAALICLIGSRTPK